MPFKSEYAKAIFKRYQHEGCETWEKLANTLVENVCGGILDKDTKYRLTQKIQKMKFIPGGRYLYYANRNERRFYQNCYLFKSQEDTKEDWVKTITKIQSSLLTGGGIGNVYTAYRAKGEPLKRTGGVASGPVAVMEMANEIGRYISQGGSRRSALWSGLHCYHKDVKEFLHVKDWDNQKVGSTGYTIGDMKRDDFAYKAPLDCTNISVIYDKPEHLETDIFLENCEMALKNGEPGFSFNFDDPEESLRNAPLSADTLILVKDQNDINTITIRQSLGKKVTVWSGSRWANNVLFKITNKDVVVLAVSYKLNDTGNIHTIKADPSHEFILESKNDILYNNLHDKQYRVKASLLQKGDRLLVANPDEEPTYATITDIVISNPEDVYCADVKVSEHSFWANGVIVSNCTEVTSADDNDVCNIGSINMARIDSLEDMLETARLGSLFLYCGTITGSVPTEGIRLVRDKNRRIGLGLMGIHEWLIRRRHRYEMNEELRKYLMTYEVGSEHCNKLADKMGLPRPIKYRAIAPTGTIGILSSTTTGMEPIFAKAYIRKYAVGIDKYHYQYVIDPIVRDLVNEGIPLDSIETATELSTDIERRVKFQYELQKYIDQGISSTINLPPYGSVDVNNFSTVLKKYAHGLRGLTVYPDGARGGQPLQSVDYYEAEKNQGKIYEHYDSCKDGVCGA